MNIILGCEESQAVTIELRKKGHNAYSCDLKECSGGHPEWHLQMDVLEAVKGGKLKTQTGVTIFIKKWDAGLFFPECTYLTKSAEWAYKPPPYHQKVKPTTLTGEERIKARKQAHEFVLKLWNCGIEKISIENPVGALSTLWQPPTQIIQPYYFGDNESKKTCLWLKGLPPLIYTAYATPRIINGKARWENQTDKGENKISSGKKRAEIRSKTYPGIAKAMANQWF